MRLLIFSLDKNCLDVSSPVFYRLQAYAELLTELIVLLPHQSVEEINRGRLRIIASGGNNKMCQWWRLFFLAWRLLKNKEFDLLSVQDTYFLAGLVALLAKFFRLPWEIQVHGWEKCYVWRRYLAKKLLAQATGVRTVSHRLKESLIKEFKVKSAKIYLAPIYTPKPAIGFIPPRATGQKVLLAVARLVPVKNLSLLIRAFAEAFSHRPEVVLWLVGAGPEQAKLMALIKQLGLTERVTLWGRQYPIGAWYQQADVVVISSDAEGWGQVAVEAGYFAKPVVMTDVGLAGECLQDGVNGRVVPVGEQKILAQVLSEMLADENYGRTLGQAWQATIEQLPDWPTSLALYIEGWKGLISKYKK